MYFLYIINFCLTDLIIDKTNHLLENYIFDIKNCPEKVGIFSILGRIQSLIRIRYIRIKIRYVTTKLLYTTISSKIARISRKVVYLCLLVYLCYNYV